MSPPPPRPSHFGRYEVEDELGTGSMGVVYLCLDPRLNRPVAIKVLRESAVPDPGRSARSTRRASATRRRRRAGSAIRTSSRSSTWARPTWSWSTWRAEPWPRCFEAARAPLGAPGRARSSAGSPTPSTTPTATASCTATSSPPTSCCTDGRRGEGDGLRGGPAGVLHPDRRSGTVVGSVRYMSPEQMMGDRVDGRADVFSLAAVAYELLTGRAPFPGKTVTEVVSRVVHGAHVPPRQADARLPEAMNAVFARAFAPKPENRLAREHRLRPRPARPRPNRDLRSPKPERDSSAPCAAPPAANAATRPPERPSGLFMAPESTAAPREALLLLECDPIGDAEVDGRSSRPDAAGPGAVASAGTRCVCTAAGREPVEREVELSADRPFQAPRGCTLPRAPQPAPGELVAFGPASGAPAADLRDASCLPRDGPGGGLEGQRGWSCGSTGEARSRSVSLKRSAGAPLDEALLAGGGGLAIRPPLPPAGRRSRCACLVRHLFRR